ncbi:MAG: hypothetical protein IIZ48_00800, partial [Erysipelotrichales bacterium]|nr:hypothetical protein [Erysipelotrichales bacterium]
EVTYTWAEDNSSVTATRVCANDESHVETETATTTSEVTKAATCEGKGETTYTAVFENEAFATQTKTVENIEALGHKYGEPVWNWAEDYLTADAVFTCEYDASHTKTVKAQVTKSADKEGNTVYTAEAEFEGKTYIDTKTVEKEPEPAEETFKIIVDQNGEGTVIASLEDAKKGDTVNLAVTPAEGYELGEVLVNGKPLKIDENGRGNFTVEGETTVSVTFKASEYRFIEGMNQTWTKGSGKTAFFKTDGLFKLFEGLTVDGKDVPESAYDAAEGSTEITFKAEYLETLAAGDHLLEAKYQNGSHPKTSFKVEEAKEEPAPVQPETGTKGLSPLWYMMTVLSAMFFILIEKKKNEDD